MNKQRIPGPRVITDGVPSVTVPACWLPVSRVHNDNGPRQFERAWVDEKQTCNTRGLIIGDRVFST